MKWTSEQMQVIESRGSNLLVAAAAGSGKTAVLVERIIRLVTEGNDAPDIDSILVVTFTQAAAAEMKDRVRRALISLASQGNVRARKQLPLVADAQISTIHSFCLNILQEHFHEAGLEPGFRLGDQAECALLLEEAMDKLLDDYYTQDPMEASFSELLDCHAGYRDDKRLKDHIFALRNFSRSLPWPDHWMEETVRKLRAAGDRDFSENEYGLILLEQCGSILEHCISVAGVACRLAEDAGLDSYAETFNEDKASLIGLVTTLDNSRGWDNILRAIQAHKFLNIKRAPKNADPEAKEILQALRKQIKDAFAKLKSEVMTDFSAGIINELRVEADRHAKLVSLAKGLERNYSRMKRRRNIIDFGDMEHLALALLCGEAGNKNSMASAKSLSETMKLRWHSVMVDEYQDSNLVQESILSAVASPEIGNLFMVGDVKQSIYRFRQAMPELFMEKYASYAEAPGEVNRKILLHKNFRSREAILEAVNAAFSRLMTRSLGELDYTVAESLQAGMAYPDAVGSFRTEVSLCVISKAVADLETDSCSIPSGSKGNSSSLNNESGAIPQEDSGHLNGQNIAREGDASKDGENIDEEELSGFQEEAIWAASELKRIVLGDNAGIPLFVRAGNGDMRPAEYSDCAVLLRSTKLVAEVFAEEFTRYGIPFISESGQSYLATTEVGVILSFLQVIDNPRQDIPLATVLRSPIFSWTETEIAEVHWQERDADLIDAIRGSKEAHAAKCAHFLARYDALRVLAHSFNVSELIEHIYEETGYALHVAALPNGARRLANLRLLADRATKYEKTGYRGLYQFIKLTERIRSDNGNLDGVRALGEKENCVRIMSIHKSKGLEFPVVLLCGAGRKFNLMERSDRFLMHHRYGVGPDYVQPEMGTSWPTAAKRALQYVFLKEALSEEMRILYVALTRAKEKLMVFARLKDPHGVLAGMSHLPDTGPLPSSYLLRQHSHALWLMAAWRPLLLKEQQKIEFRIATSTDIARTGLSLARNFPQPKTTAINGGGSLAPNASNELKKADTQFPLRGAGFGKFDVAMQCEEQNNSEKNENINDLIKEAERRISWRPPNEELSRVPAKMSISTLKKLQLNPDNDGSLFQDESKATSYYAEADVLPRFISADKEEVRRSGTAYGLLMHKILEHLVPQNGWLPDIEQVIDSLVKKKIITEYERRIPDRSVLEKFVSSNLYARMALAPRVNMETAFTIRVPASQVMNDASLPETETIILQGIIDCWFVEDGKIVLVDYKTDKTKARLEEYRRQIKWYSIALEKTAGLPVKECLLWFLLLGEAV